MALVCGGSTKTWSMTSLMSSLPSPSPTSSSSSLPYLNFPTASLSTTGQLKLSTRKTRINPILIPTYTGLSLSPLSPFVPLGFSFDSPTITIVRNGGFKVYAMRHGRKVPKLNRPPDQRKALLRGLTTQLLKYGRIKTTRARASAMRKYVDKMITLAKEGSLHKRRQALGFIYEKQIVHALFAEVPDRYGDRNGGYTRIIRTLPRRGDNAPMAYIELV